ncbi:hypothetical protein MPER_04164, partial [Moniliophthora perniciosa FA553]
MPYSHHSHSGQFCKHASGTLEEVVLEAIRQGFEVIFTHKRREWTLERSWISSIVLFMKLAASRH